MNPSSRGGHNSDASDRERSRACDRMTSHTDSRQRRQCGDEPARRQNTININTLINTNTEPAVSTASCESAGRQSERYSADGPVSNRRAKTSASSSTRSGRIATGRHWKRRYAELSFAFSMLSKICSYATCPGSDELRQENYDAGFRAGRTPIETCLCEPTESITIRNCSHAVRSLREGIDHQLLFRGSPLPHLPIRVDDGVHII